MAKQVIINVKANTANARSELDETKAEIKKLNSEVVKVGDKSPKEFKKLEKGSKKTGDSIKKTTTGFKAFGIALKGLGIGLLIGAFAVLQDLFKQNQRITDIFKVSFEALSLVFADFVRFFDKAIIDVKSFFETLFTEPQTLVKDFLRTVVDRTIVRFQSLLDMAGFLGSAFKKLFSGDFAGALEDANSAGSELVDVFTGVDDSVDKIQDTFIEGAKSIANYTKSTVKQAESNVKLRKSAELAAIANQGLIEKFDRQAEQLRQLRDERLSIEERKKANDELGKVLDEQEKIMLKNAQMALDSALIQLEKDKENIESKKAVMEAENELAAIQAQIDGFRSEQKTNDLALDRETIDLINSKKEAENSLLIDKQRFNAEQIENEFLRLQALKDVAEEEKKLEVARLTEKRDSFNQGTQAFIDAQTELDDFQQKSGQESIKLTADIEKAKQTEIQNALGNVAGIVGANSKFGKAIAIVGAIRSTYRGATAALESGNIFGFIQAAAIIAAGLANVKTIKGTQDPPTPSFASGGGAGSSGVSVPTPQAPAFNIVGSDPQNQLAQTLADATSKPVKAFVVAGDVSTAQSLDRNIIEESSLG